MFSTCKNALVFKDENICVRIEPCGKDALRVRARLDESFGVRDYALLPQAEVACKINISEKCAEIANGKARAVIEESGKLSFYNENGKLLLEEYYVPKPLKKKGKEFLSRGDGKYRINLRFLANEGEKIFGMGQYQQPFLDVKGATLELAHRNSQASVPFYISNRGYGFIYHMPSIGEVSFGKNITTWKAEMGEEIDYIIISGDAPSEILEKYMALTGKPPMMPEYAMGFWQSKLRYWCQEDLLSVAREYYKRKIPLSVIVCDFFHWPNQGDFKFDKNYFPDPEGMVKELNDMGTELMVSVWPTVDFNSENYREMEDKGYLIKNHRGRRNHMDCVSPAVFYDATNPEAGEFVWSKAKENYYKHGIKIFWLDEAEPEYEFYDYDNHIYHLGDCLEVGNIYPQKYAENFYNGMAREGQENILNLIRCAWLGSQKYGALVWSGDIAPTFEALGCQVRAGLNMAMSGIPWWTTDIGGFDGGTNDDPKFRQLIARWFEYAAFSPVLRMHGCRDPWFETFPEGGEPTSGGGKFGYGAPNEIWSYGEECEQIFTKYIFIRERLKPYIKELMAEAHETGTPPMRPLFYDFPSDTKAWGINDEYMFGGDLLVAPIINENELSRQVYLPSSKDAWINVWTGEGYTGGQTVEVDAPIDKIPLFIRNGGKLNRNIFIGE
ncbi:MAG: DUF4968 domain-containing protein [Clostridia bacterium]|nr:DUF4968 domain-containing protein [Clostridia bacterium]